jgi:CubicO group peptidase (beta-lactamase class C family)
METLRIEVPTGVVEGTFDGAFAPVVDAFVANFHERGELGASLCVTHEGRTVIDVWGGSAEPLGSWTSDTISIVHSCTKGATALCAHLLADRGLLDIEAPVAEYWPEFADGGKEKATVRMMLDHSVGVPVFRGPLEAGELYDWDRVIARLEDEEPFWEPGARNGYHMINFGWTVGELVRRVSGRSLGTFFAEEIAGPLGIDFWIGLPEAEESRVAPLAAHRPEPGGGAGQRLSLFVQTLLGDRTSIPALAMANLSTVDANSRPYHAAEIGGGGGITNGRGLAGMYTPLALRTGLVSAAAVDRMRRVSVATNDDATLRIATRFALGFMVSMDNRGKLDKDSVVLGEHALGHVGMGGSIGFADPSLGVALGYTMNRMGMGILLNERGQSIVDALYGALRPPA